MGTFISQDYDVAEGQQWCDYFARMTSECRRLTTEGRIPATDGMDAFLDDSTRVLGQVWRDVAAARAKRELRTRTVLTITAEERKRLFTMSESLLNLLLILEMRKALVLDRTEAVARVAQALDEGTFTP